MTGFFSTLGATWDIKTLMLLQLGLEALLVGFLLVLIRRSRKAKDDPALRLDRLKESVEHFLRESEKISAAFAENLRDKKELSADLILKLDRRLADYRELLKTAEHSFGEAQKQLAEMPPPPASRSQAEGDKANPAAPEVRTLVLRLARKGHTPEEIAARAKLLRGEVELIIDLERQFKL